MLMQDGTICHDCPLTIESLQSKCLIIPEWPPNSPDLNLIEILWSIMKQKIKSQKPTNIFEFEKIIQIVWSFLNETKINDLVNDFKRRLELVKQVDGRIISHYLSSHRFQVIETDIYHDLPELFSIKEDELIIEKFNFYEQNGKIFQLFSFKKANSNWKQISLFSSKCNEF
jgi:hypothetical protein